MQFEERLDFLSKAKSYFSFQSHFDVGKVNKIILHAGMLDYTAQLLGKKNKNHICAVKRINF